MRTLINSQVAFPSANSISYEPKITEIIGELKKKKNLLCSYYSAAAVLCTNLCCFYEKGCYIKNCKRHESRTENFSGGTSVSMGRESLNPSGFCCSCIWSLTFIFNQMKEMAKNLCSSLGPIFLRNLLLWEFLMSKELFLQHASIMVAALP